MITKTPFGYWLFDRMMEGFAKCREALRIMLLSSHHFSRDHSWYTLEIHTAASLDLSVLGPLLARSIFLGVFENGGGKVSRRRGGRCRGSLGPSLTARGLSRIGREVGVEGVDLMRDASLPDQKSIVIQTEPRVPTHC